MKLYITPTSPYGRIARIVAHEKGLASRVVIVAARTREAESPYYAVVPSGRVPYLERDDGPGLEDSALICRYLDHSDRKPRLHPAPDQLYHQVADDRDHSAGFRQPQNETVDYGWGKGSYSSNGEIRCEMDVDRIFRKTRTGSHMERSDGMQCSETDDIAGKMG